MNCRYNEDSASCLTQQRSTLLKLGIMGLMFLGVLVTPKGISHVEAATSASTQLNLQVLPILKGRLRIVGPPSVTLTHNGSDNDQQFGLQQWDVHCNAKPGASVTFGVTNPFRCTVAGVTYRRDARLNVSIARAAPLANWRVTVPVDQTRYALGDNTAVVSAISDNVGDATFNLRVTFITSDFSTLVAGTYSTMVTGTITANHP